MKVSKKLYELGKLGKYDEVITLCEASVVQKEIGLDRALGWKALALSEKGCINEAYQILKNLTINYPDDLRHLCSFVNFLYDNQYDYSEVEENCDLALGKKDNDGYDYYKDFFLVVKAFIKLENNDALTALRLLDCIEDKKSSGIYIKKRYWSHEDLIERASRLLEKKK
jgi:hypothetical protein